jgi:exodeoxyribonuclease-3
MKKITVVTYNVNGIRSALSKGFAEWLAITKPDIVCLQEIKANPDQFDTSVFEQLGYFHYWNPAQKKGYSGVAILSKIKPKNVTMGCGNDTYDIEGRVIQADFDNFSIVNTYFPSGSSGETRQDVKMQFLKDYLSYINQVKNNFPKLLVAGDYNICHQSIDIHDPVSNKNSSGFLPEERAWMDDFFNQGFIDSFREFNKNPHQYSWWSFRANARNNNKGWRIDYINASVAIKKNLSDAAIWMDVKHSDHCPVMLQLAF